MLFIICKPSMTSTNVYKVCPGWCITIQFKKDKVYALLVKLVYLHFTVSIVILYNIINPYFLFFFTS